MSENEKDVDDKDMNDKDMNEKNDEKVSKERKVVKKKKKRKRRRKPSSKVEPRRSQRLKEKNDKKENLQNKKLENENLQNKNLQEDEIIKQNDEESEENNEREDKYYFDLEDDKIDDLLKYFFIKTTIDNINNPSNHVNYPNYPPPPPPKPIINPKDLYGPDFYKIQKFKEIKFYKPFDNLKELIELGETYDPSIIYNCNIDMKKLHHIVEPLKELDQLIGLDKFKKSIIDQIIYILTNNSSMMMHTAIYGKPGVGKTECGKILAKIYASSGLLSKGHFKVAKREDFVAGYIGHTAIQTKSLLEEMKGGVLFIDEAYSMGSKDNKDYFAKEAVDTINVFLSENYSDFICIIAGYEDEIKNYFFAQNPGLERRFTFKYIIDNYSEKEMKLMFEKFVKDDGWRISRKGLAKLDKIFSKNKSHFPYFGGNIKTFFEKCKIVHMKEIIMLDKKYWKIFTDLDIQRGFNSYMENREIPEKVELSYFM